MKKVFYSVLAVCAFSVMACQKENAETPVLSNEEKTGVAPLTFGSVSEIRNVLYSMQDAGSDGISTKSISSNPDFQKKRQLSRSSPGNGRRIRKTSRELSCDFYLELFTPPFLSCLLRIYYSARQQSFKDARS